MLFNSAVFLFFFLPISLLAYYALARWRSVPYAKAWLCGASFFFYGWWNPAFVLLLVGSIAFNYFISHQLKGDDDPSPRQRAILTFGIAANLLLLFYYKYLFPVLGFFDSMGWGHFDYGSVILPIGISFFTFTQIGYLVDCHQGLVRDRGLLNYVLFVTFFPHLIAGPILHHREIMPQFANDESYKFRIENLSVGLTLFAFGMVKKVMLADTIGPWAEMGFDHAQSLGGIEAWSVALAYSMQLYFDFSGYSDMAIGLGIMFGIKLPLNFNSPYQSLSIIDFWQRWHMTLTRYITLLLYNPVSLWVSRRRQRAGLPISRQAAATPMGFASMIALPTFITLLLAGVWHGAGLQFIIYGVLHATYLTVNHAWRIFNPTKAAAKTHVSSSWFSAAYSYGWRLILTYLCVLVAQIFFRAKNVSDGMAIIASAMGLHGSGLPWVIPLGNVQYLGPLQSFLLDNHVFVVGLRETYDTVTRPLFENLGLGLVLALIAFTMPNVYQILTTWSPALNKVKSLEWLRLAWKPNLAWAVGVGTMLFLTTLYFDRTGRFLYFQF